MDILQLYKDEGALLNGHFILSSGLHSDTYLQSALALHKPENTAKIASALIQSIGVGAFSDVSKIIAPAMGGLIIGYEVARQLNKPFIFLERVAGEFELRRGFEINNNDKLVVIEDIVTTGKSSLETIRKVESLGGEVSFEACIINRNINKNPIAPTELYSLAEIEIESYDPADLPEHLSGSTAVKPGSRAIRS